MGGHDGARCEQGLQHPQRGGGAVGERRTAPALAFRIERFERLASTQATLRARLDSGERVHGLVVRADVQDAAVGRRGRRFEARAGGSYQSLAVSDAPVEGALDLGRSPSVAVGVGIASVLSRYGARVGLKWPNDLVYAGRKLGGILCERVRGHLLIGVGVNVANEVPAGATSLRGWDVDGVSLAVLEGVQEGLALLVEGAALGAAFVRYDVLADRRVALWRDGVLLGEGVAAGLDGEGRLRVRRGGRVDVVVGATVRLIDG